MRDDLFETFLNRVEAIARQVEVIFNDPAYDVSLPPDPMPEQIQRMLSEVPRQIEYLDVLIADTEDIIRHLRILQRDSERELQRQRAEVRQEAIRKYELDLQIYNQTAEEKLAQIKDKAMRKMVQEHLRSIRPMKPTVDDLNDLATLKTQAIEQDLLHFERLLARLRACKDRLQAKRDALENKFIAVRAHKSILVEQLRQPL